MRADGNASYCWVHRRTQPQRLRIATVRRFGLPSVERGGTLSPLTLETDAGLADMTHVVFFSGNIAGADLNFYGPRLNRLEEYFAVKAKDVCPPLSFETLLNPDVARQLNSFRELRLLDLRVRRSDTEVLERKHRSLFETFRAMKQLGTAQELGLILKPEKHKRDDIGDDTLALAKDIANDDVSRNCATRFVVKGVDSEGNVTEVDILKDQLLARKRVLRLDNQYRTIIPDTAFDAIEQAYDDLQDEIERAAGIRL